MGGTSLGPISTGVQLIRSTEVAAQIYWSPQYIQYAPFIFVATILPFSYVETMEPDLDHWLRYFPLYAFAKAGPYLVQCNKSEEPAIINLASLPSYAV